ncbi:MAG: substrate binding domain-containing protein, partial [Caulobacteraceae bacterium]
PEFMALHPLLSMELTVSNHREEMMTGADVAVRFGPPDAASLIARKLLETRVLTCASPTYLDRHGWPCVPQDLIHHEGLLFRDPQTGRAFTWEFHRGEEVVEVQVGGRVMMDDPSVAVAACVAGQGVFQSFELGLAPWLESGELVSILTTWAEERFPLYAYHPSRHLPPAKVRAFLDFVQKIAAGEQRSINIHPRDSEC